MLTRRRWRVSYPTNGEFKWRRLQHSCNANASDRLYNYPTQRSTSDATTKVERIGSCFLNSPLTDTPIKRSDTLSYADKCPSYPGSSNLPPNTTQSPQNESSISMAPNQTAPYSPRGRPCTNSLRSYHHSHSFSPFSSSHFSYSHSEKAATHCRPQHLTTPHTWT